MKKYVLGIIFLTVSLLVFLCHISQRETKTYNISKIEQYSVDDGIINLFQIDIPEPMPKVVDAIVDESEIVVLCEDGSVWSWEKGKDKNTAHKIQNLNNVKKIVYAGSAIYALSEDGYVYAWGSNEWLQIDARVDEDKIFEEARKIAGLSDIVDIDASIDTNSSRVRAFARDKSGNFYMWGVFLHWLEDEDRYPGFPEEHIELVQGVDKVFAGAGNYHYFIREDGTIFSIMGTSFWKNENIIDFIFPSLPIEIGDYQMDNKPLDRSEIYYVDLREGTKYGITILYELGQEKASNAWMLINIQCLCQMKREDFGIGTVK